jgi:hypothetical protein
MNRGFRRRGRHGRSPAARIRLRRDRPGADAWRRVPEHERADLLGGVTGLGPGRALVGYVIFTLGLGIGDTDIFDWGGLLSALIGTFIVLGLAGYFLRRRQPPPTHPSTPGLPGDEGPRPTV